MAKLDQARIVALNVLNSHSDSRLSSDHVMPTIDSSLRNSRDRRFTRNLVLGSLRWRLRLDWIIDQYSNQPTKKLQTSVLNILRLGVLQIEFMDRIPNHAAVFSSVQLAKHFKIRSASSYINAVLRTFLRKHRTLEYPDVTKDPVNFLSTYYSHPEWLTAKWLKRWGFKQTSTILNANNEPSGTWLRPNPMRDNYKKWRDEVSLINGPDGYYQAKDPSTLFLSQAFKEGCCQIQDPSAGLAVKLLAPQPGELVLDLCSAPGGKATQIAENMKNEGFIVAADISVERLRKVLENSRRLGLNIVRCVAWDGLNSTRQLFDKILLDVPCSGTGIIGRHPEYRWNKNVRQFKILTEIQRKLLTSAFASLRPGGTLVYSTCSLEKEENEDIVENFARETQSADIQWARNYLINDTRATRFVQSIPGLHVGDGAFAARIQRYVT